MADNDEEEINFDGSVDINENNDRNDTDAKSGTTTATSIKTRTK